MAGCIARPRHWFGDVTRHTWKSEKIHLDDLPDMIGRRVGLSWAHPCALWTLESISGSWAVLVTEAGNRRNEHVDDLCYGPDDVDADVPEIDAEYRRRLEDVRS